MILDMLNYYRMIDRLNINIIYSGPIWPNGIEGIAMTVKKRLEFDALPLSASQSVFSVFIEQMMNMLMYSAEKEVFCGGQEEPVEASKGVFVLGAKDKTYFVQSGNVMRQENVGLLKGRIDHLNTLDKAGLRKYYKERLRSEDKNPESKGGGLGLIEIAKRASSKIEYSFTPLEDEMVFFSMYVAIG